MKCPVCEGKTKVYDSRPNDYTTRRRKCVECDFTFKTYEISYEGIQEILEGRIPRASLVKTMNVFKEEFDGVKNAMGFEGNMRKMSPKKVRELRKRYENGEKVDQLAIDYGIASKTVIRIVRRIRWAHVD